jgi:hypothetical protein
VQTEADVNARLDHFIADYGLPAPRTRGWYAAVAGLSAHMVLVVPSRIDVEAWSQALGVAIEVVWSGHDSGLRRAWNVTRSDRVVVRNFGGIVLSVLATETRTAVAS